MISCLISLLGCVVAVLVFLDFLVKRFTWYNLARSMPGPRMYPIVGSLGLANSSQDETFSTMDRYCKEYPNGFRYWSFGALVYHTYSAELVEKILTNPKNIEKSFVYKFLHPWLGTGLLTSFGEKWFARRKLLTPAFHFNILKGFQAIFNKQTDLLLNEIQVNEVDRTEGTNLQKLISRFTLNVICGSAMGVEPKRIDELDHYLSKIHKIGELFIERCYRPYYFFDWTYKLFGNERLNRKIVHEAHEFTGDIITMRREEFNAKQQTVNWNGEQDADSKKMCAMLDKLLIAQKSYRSIDDSGIQEEVDTFILGGFDTSMTSITFILLMIANHNDVQQRLFAEIASIGSDDNYADVEYLNAIIKESLRLYPPIPTIGRVLGEDTIVDNVKLPAKTLVHIRIYAMHRDPKYFDNPEKFDPDRFLKDNLKHPFCYIPFSAGQRNCIGQKFARKELQTVIAKIVENFELEPITKPKDIVMLTDLVLRTKEPIYIRFIPRST